MTRYLQSPVPHMWLLPVPFLHWRSLSYCTSMHALAPHPCHLSASWLMAHTGHSCRLMLFIMVCGDTRVQVALGCNFVGVRGAISPRSFLLLPGTGAVPRGAVPGLAPPPRQGAGLARGADEHAAAGVPGGRPPRAPGAAAASQGARQRRGGAPEALARACRKPVRHGGCGAAVMCLLCSRKSAPPGDTCCGSGHVTGFDGSLECCLP